MAAPSLEQWIEGLGLQQVNDPDVGRPLHPKPFGNHGKLSAESEAHISSSLREAQDQRNLPRSKLPPPPRERIRLLALRIERFPVDGGSIDTPLRGSRRNSERDFRACSTASVGPDRSQCASADGRHQERRRNLRGIQLAQSAREDPQKRPRRLRRGVNGADTLPDRRSHERVNGHGEA